MSVASTTNKVLTFAKKRRVVLANPEQHHPAVVEWAERHAASIQLRVADAITSFAGSMKFVYIHALIFALWMGFNLLAPAGFDKYPFGLLTLIVSLEAIFLSTFVMIGQNRQATFQQAKADHDFNTEQAELDENTTLTREIHAQTAEVARVQAELHAMVKALTSGATPEELQKLLKSIETSTANTTAQK